MKELTNKEMKSVDGGTGTSQNNSLELRMVKRDCPFYKDIDKKESWGTMPRATIVKIREFSSHKSKLPKGFKSTGTKHTHVVVVSCPKNKSLEKKEGYIYYTAISNGQFLAVNYGEIRAKAEKL